MTTTDPAKPGDATAVDLPKSPHEWVAKLAKNAPVPSTFFGLALVVGWYVSDLNTQFRTFQAGLIEVRRDKLDQSAFAQFVLLWRAQLPPELRTTVPEVPR